MKKEKTNEYLDLRGIACPINFVRAKLKLEEMNKGDLLELIIDSGEPMANVPRSIKEEGHKIISVQKIDSYFSLLIEKL